MAKRKYYPKSYIIEGLFTKGKELMYLTGKEYIGPYHKYIDGISMTGSVYNEKTSEPLVKYQKNEKSEKQVVYDSVVKVKSVKFRSPKSIRLSLNLDDYKLGYIERFFVKKRNDITSRIIEIDKDQYDLLGQTNVGIDNDLYFGISLKWKISGPEYDIIENGRVKVSGIVDTNTRTLFSKEVSMPGIKNFLSDLREYSVVSRLVTRQFKNKLKSL